METCYIKHRYIKIIYGKFMTKKNLFIILCLTFISLYSKEQTKPTIKICILIPAYNESNRIQEMLDAYLSYFKSLPMYDTTFLVVANNCNDNTVEICEKIQKNHPNLEIIDLKPGGKGYALKMGFLHALKKQYDYIGFVDADMATLPQYYHDLIKALPNTDGVIASRYIAGAHVWPKRPMLRKIGGKLYNWMLRRKLNIPFKDTQCGAKIFTYDTIKRVAPLMTEQKWAWDLEFLYLCKLEGKQIKEIPTTWSDQPGSHLKVSSSLAKDFLDSPKRIKARHKQLALQKKIEQRINKKKFYKKTLKN